MQNRVITEIRKRLAVQIVSKYVSFLVRRSQSAKIIGDL
jgi:hypothetical protein